MVRKLKDYMTNTKLDFTNDKYTNINQIYLCVSDLFISIMTDKRLNSTEKTILGIILEDAFTGIRNEDLGDGKLYEVGYIASDIKCYKDTVINISEYITTDYLVKEINTTKKTIFNNIYSLVEKKLISFGREGFSEYGKIKLNIGFIASEFYK